MLGLGTQTELGIGIAIQLQDQFSGTADRVLWRMQTLKQETNAMINQAAVAYRNQAAMVSAGAFAISGSFWNMTKSVSEFGHKINQVDIIGEGRLGKTKNQLSKFAQTMGVDFATRPGEVASAMFENTKQGITRGLSDITKYELAVSKATDESVTGVSNHLLHIMNAYDMTTQQFPRIANAITAAANATTASVTSIGEGMQYAAFPAKQFNVRLEETLALVAKLQQAGISPSGSGTALQNMFTYLGTTTSSLASKKQNEMWQRLGLSKTQMGSWMNHGKVFDVLTAIDKQLTNIAPNERAGILKGLVNVRGTRAVLGSFGNSDPSKSLAGILASIDKGVTNDVALKQSKAMMNDPYSQFLKLQVSWENFKINFVAKAAPMIMKVLGGVTKFIDHVLTPIASSPIGTVFAGLLGIGLPLVGALFAFRAAVLTTTLVLRNLGPYSLGNPTFGNIIRAQLGQYGGMGMAGGWGGNAPFPNRNPSSPTYGSNFFTSPYLAAGGNVVGFNRPYTYNSYAGAGNFNSRKQFLGNLGNLVSSSGYVYPKETWIPKNYNGQQMSNLNPFAFTRGNTGPRIYNNPGLMANGPMAGAGYNAFNIMNTKNMIDSAESMGPAAVSTAANTTRMLPMLGRIGSGLLNAIPILGQILGAITVISAVASWFMGEKKEVDPEYVRFKDAMDSNLFKYQNPIGGNILSQIRGGGDAKGLLQHIYITVDGNKIAEHVVEQKMDDSLEKYLHFNPAY